MKSLALLLSLALVAAAASPAVCGAPDPAPAPSRLDAIKALAGTWTSAGEGGQPGPTVSYRVTSGGSTVMETLFAGTPKEMVTMYTMDGADLVLTHYCAMGNQPHMKAAPGTDAKSIAFSFVSGGNLKSRDEMHMDSLTLTFVDAKHLRQDWTLYQEGKVVKSIDLEFTKAAD